MGKVAPSPAAKVGTRASQRERERERAGPLGIEIGATAPEKKRKRGKKGTFKLNEARGVVRRSRVRQSTKSGDASEKQTEKQGIQEHNKRQIACGRSSSKDNARRKMGRAGQKSAE